MAKNIDENAVILIDENDCGTMSKEKTKVLCTAGKGGTLVGLWIKNPITIEKINLDSDYIITTNILNLELIKKTENDIYLYKNRRDNQWK